MMDSYSWLRFKHSVATNTRLIVAGCVLVALLSAAVVFTGFVTEASAVSPLAEDDDATTSFHAASVEQHATVVVRNDTDAYDPGDRLRDASLYPLANASDPVLEANATVDNGRLRNLTLAVTYTASRSGDDGDPFYEKTVVLDASSGSGSTAAVTARLPIDDVLAERDALESEFGEGVTVSVAVRTTAAYAYRNPAGRTVAREVAVGGAIERVGRLYALPTGSDRATHRPGASDAADAGMSSFGNFIGIVALVSSVVFGVATAVGDRYVDATEVAQEIQWQRFRDWVTEVESYTPQGDVNTVEVTNLNDLVNLAIDTNRRVLFHRPVEEYIVVEDDVMYKYTPERRDDAGSTELFGLRKEDLAETEFPNFEALAGGDAADEPQRPG